MSAATRAWSRPRPADRDWQDVTADPRSLNLAVDALEAVRVLADLPERERNDLSLVIAGYSYAEIRVLTPGRAGTKHNKSLVKARARIRRAHPDRTRAL